MVGIHRNLINMKILLVQTAFLGDCVLTTPLIHAIRDAYPGAELSVLTTPSGAGIFENNPHLDEIIVYDKRNENEGFGEFFRLAGKLRKQGFDLAIIPHRSFRSGFLCFAGGIRQRIGFSAAPGSIFYTASAHRNMELHEAERLLELLTPLGFESTPLPTELFPGNSDRTTVATFLEKHGFGGGDRILAVAPGSVWGTKRYPIQQFAETVSILLSESDFSGAVLIGGENDSDLAEVIICATDGNAVSAVGIGGILTAAALIERSSVLIGNDSAPAHIAAAVGTPVVAIFGPTVREFGFVPYSNSVTIVETEEELKCRPCSRHGKMTCSHHDCMKTIPPRRVAEAVQNLLLGDPD